MIMAFRLRLQWLWLWTILLFTTPIRCYFRFIIEPSDIVTISGKTVRLDCKANLNSSGKIPQYRWTLDGENLDLIGDTRRSLLKNGSLLIKNVFNNNEKDISEGLEAYQCVAESDFVAAVSRTATVTLSRLSTFDKQPTDLRLLPGQTAYFPCVITSQPPPKITWLKDNSPLVTDARMTIFPSALEIDHVHKNDNGAYRCNVTGLDRHRLSDPGLLTIVDNEDTIKRLKSLKFVAIPHSTIALEGSNVYLDCAAIGNPRPQMSWSKDGTLIDVAHLGTRFSIIGTGGLLITQVNKNDDGIYICRAENHEGSADTSVTLEVHVKPLIIRKPKDTMVLEKLDITLECEVVGKPPPHVIWLKNGEQIKQSDNFKFVNGTNLKISELMTADSGIFQCLASNSAGNTHSSAFLNVVKEQLTTYQEQESNREHSTNSSKTDITINELIPDKHYITSNREVTSPGMNSLEVVVVTKPPQNIFIEAISSTEINIKWHPKSSQHTAVTGYKIQDQKKKEKSYGETTITTTDKLKTNVISPNAIDITTILYVMIACCFLLIFCIGIEISLLCCKTLNVITLNK